MSVASRTVGRRMQIAGSGTSLNVFGPLLPGEIVRRVVLYWDNAAPSAGDQLQVDIAVFAESPATAAVFASAGRALTVSSPRLPVALRTAELPLEYTANEVEKFVAVLVTELAADATDGSIWVELCGVRGSELYDSSLDL